MEMYNAIRGKEGIAHAAISLKSPVTTKTERIVFFPGGVCWSVVVAVALAQPTILGRESGYKCPDEVAAVHKPFSPCW